MTGDFVTSMVSINKNGDPHGVTSWGRSIRWCLSNSIWIQIMPVVEIIIRKRFMFRQGRINEELAFDEFLTYPKTLKTALRWPSQGPLLYLAKVVVQYWISKQPREINQLRLPIMDLYLVWNSASRKAVSSNSGWYSLSIGVLYSKKWYWARPLIVRIFRSCLLHRF